MLDNGMPKNAGENMEITAKMVAELREMTGAGMMDCKKALNEAAGDIEEAQKVLRKKGLAAASQKAGRIASEGRVVARPSADGRHAVILEVNSETDFVARNEAFRAFCDQLTDQILDEAAFSGQVSDDAGPLLNARYKGDSALTVAEFTSGLVARIGENIKPRRYVRLDAPASAADALEAVYIHGDGKIGVVVEITSDKAGSLGSAGAELGRDVAMHIAASEPRFTKRSEVTEAVIATEKEIASEQARKAGKPENLIEKIVAGRIDKFYGETVLLEQPFVKNPDLTIEKHVAVKGKELGAHLAVTRFVRFKLGEGLQKRSEDFAAEVASASGAKA